MKNTYPTGYTSIICEDIRMETGNKISLMGVFSSGQIIFNNEGS
jgi:hypothetical protein